MNSLIGKFIDGGPVFTVVIFICLILVIAIFATALMNKHNREKFILLIKHIAWFAVAWGFLGRTFGLINAFDAVAAHGELTPSLLADGLKMALVDPLMGIVTFALAHVFIIILVAIKK
ncbi:MAG: MotA/TolQ/ExbB proton channel family protein [Bacteroidales bacterium]|nr:MotA/TolQ/ExbB proton channel family protein [Bacteroidales bacterium]